MLDPINIDKHLYKIIGVAFAGIFFLTAIFSIISGADLITTILLLLTVAAVFILAAIGVWFKFVGLNTDYKGVDFVLYGLMIACLLTLTFYWLKL